MVKHTQTTRRQEFESLSVFDECLSVIDHSLELALKGLISVKFSHTTSSSLLLQHCLLE